MKNCESFEKLKEWINYGYNVRGKRNFSNPHHIAAYLVNEYEYLLHDGKTDKNCFLVVLGKQIVENSSVIDAVVYALIEKAVQETISDYAVFELTPTEKDEVYMLAKEVYEKLSSLRIE